jgi:hypothetical protein
LRPFQDDVFHTGETLVAMAIEQMVERFRRDILRLDNTSRLGFNMVRGLEDIGLEDSNKRKEIVVAARRHVESHEFKQMQAYVDSVARRQC